MNDKYYVAHFEQLEPGKGLLTYAFADGESLGWTVNRKFAEEYEKEQGKKVVESCKKENRGADYFLVLAEKRSGTEMVKDLKDIQSILLKDNDIVEIFYDINEIVPFLVSVYPVIEGKEGKKEFIRESLETDAQYHVLIIPDKKVERYFIGTNRDELTLLDMCERTYY